MPDERLNLLLQGAWDGTLDDEERSELDRRLEADPDALAAALADWRIHRQLPLVLRGADGWFATGVVRSLAAPSGRFVARVHERLPRRQRQRSAGAPSWRLASLAAAAGLAVAVGWLWLRDPRPAMPVGVAVEGSGRLIRDDHGGPLLVDGESLFRVTPGTPFAVATPHARAEVLGTRFSLSVAGDRTVLSVAEGCVRLSAGARAIEVWPGGMASAGPDGMAAEALIWSWRPSGALRSRENPAYAGNGLIRSADLSPMPRLPATGGGVRARLRSLVAGEQTVALMLVLRDPATGWGEPWKAPRRIGPGEQVIDVPLGDFLHDQPAPGAVPQGRLLEGVAILSWGAGPEAVELHAIELVTGEPTGR